MNKLIKLLTLILFITCGVSAQDVSWFGENPSAVEFRISTEAQLQGLAKLVNDGTTNFEGKTIILENDITLSRNHTPIGANGSKTSTQFRGTFDGKEYSISNLTISGDYKYTGLFGYIATNGQVKNIVVNVVNVNNIDDSKETYFGGLAGYYDSEKPIENCGVNISRNVSKCYSGGLIGYASEKFTISNSYSTGNVSSSYTYNYTSHGSYSGGLVGYTRSTTTINNSYSTGKISATSTYNTPYSGGLVGRSGEGLNISNSYALGNISSSSTSSSAYSGGLAGNAHGVTINNSYSTGNISSSGTYTISGGLVGDVPSAYKITISNSYSTGNVSSISRSSSSSGGSAISGGLIGYGSNNDTKISSSYSSGTINPQSYINTSTPYPNGVYAGGILGRALGTMGTRTYTSVYYNSEGASSASGVGSITGVTGLTPAQLKQQVNFKNWDFTNTWKITENYSTPTLKILSDFEILPISPQEYTGSQIKPSIQVRLKNGGSVLTENVDYRVVYGTNKDVLTGGSATVTRTGKFVLNTSDIAVFNITHKKLTVSGASVQDKVYDGTTAATIIGAELVGVVEEDDVSFDNLTGYFERANVGNSILVYPNISLKGAKASNYQLTLPTTIRGNITPKPLTDEFVVEINEQTYKGIQIKPSVIVRDNGVMLNEIIDYTLDLGENLNVGNGIVTIKGKGNYSSEITGKTFTIIPKPISVKGATANKIYDGTASVTITDATIDGVVGDDDVLLGDLIGIFENSDVGTNKSIIVNMSLSGEQAANYKLLQPTVTGNITAKELPQNAVQSINTQVFTGSAIIPEIIVKDGETILVKDTDYTTALSKNTNVGTASLIVAGKGNYTGTVSANFTISAKQLSDEMVTPIVAQNYTGEAITPFVILKDGSRTLVLDTDYSVDYSDNTAAGMAIVIITGVGNYAGTIIAYFVINEPKTIGELTIFPIEDQIFNDNPVEPAVTIKDGEKTLILGTDYTVFYQNNNAVGTGIVSISGIGLYSGTENITFEIIAGTILINELTILPIASQIFNGNPVEPTITIKDGEKILALGTDYMVSYLNNNAVGTGMAEITGIGLYSGTEYITFEIISGTTPITGIQELESRYGIKIMQNPATDKAEMKVILPNEERISSAKIVIYDMTGNVVFNTTTNGNIVWDLRNSTGRFVANDTYLVVAEVKGSKGIGYHYSAKFGVKR